MRVPNIGALWEGLLMEGSGNSSKNMKRKIAGWVAPAVIIMLILGYIPLSSYVLEDMTVEYTLSLKQYDNSAEKSDVETEVAVVNMDSENAYQVDGLLLEKRFTQMYLDSRGTEAARLLFDGEFYSMPEQLWLRVSDAAGDIAETPLYVKGLEDGGWSTISSGEYTLYQRGDRFGTLDEFFEYAAATDEAIGLAGCSGGEVLALGEAKGGPVSEQLVMPLRGPHKFEMVVNDNRLVVDLAKSDLNRTEGADEVSVKIFKGNQAIFSDMIEDDGHIGSEIGNEGEAQKKSVVLEGLENGSYRLEIGNEASGKDFIITSLATNAIRSAFVDQVFLFDPVEIGIGQKQTRYSLDLYVSTNGGTLSATTWHPQVERSVLLGGETIIGLEGVEEAGIISKEKEVARGDYEMEVSNPGSIILNMPDTGFSFKPGSVFEPGLNYLQPLWSSTVDSYSLILTRGYVLPETDGARIACGRDLDLRALGISGSTLNVIIEKIGSQAVLTSLRLRLE